MTLIYQAIGRAVVVFIVTRFRRQLRIAAAVAVAGTVAAAYLLANRDVEEG